MTSIQTQMITMATECRQERKRIQNLKILSLWTENIQRTRKNPNLTKQERAFLIKTVFF